MKSINESILSKFGEMLSESENSDFEKNYKKFIKSLSMEFIVNGLCDDMQKVSEEDLASNKNDPEKIKKLVVEKFLPSAVKDIVDEKYSEFESFAGIPQDDIDSDFRPEFEKKFTDDVLKEFEKGKYFDYYCTQCDLVVYAISNEKITPDKIKKSLAVQRLFDNDSDSVDVLEKLVSGENVPEEELKKVDVDYIKKISEDFKKALKNGKSVKLGYRFHQTLEQFFKSKNGGTIQNDPQYEVSFGFSRENIPLKGDFSISRDHYEIYPLGEDIVSKFKASLNESKIYGAKNINESFSNDEFNKLLQSEIDRLKRIYLDGEIFIDLDYHNYKALQENDDFIDDVIRSTNPDQTIVSILYDYYEDTIMSVRDSHVDDLIKSISWKLGDLSNEQEEMIRSEFDENFYVSIPIEDIKESVNINAVISSRYSIHSSDFGVKNPVGNDRYTKDVLEDLAVQQGYSYEELSDAYERAKNNEPRSQSEFIKSMVEEMENLMSDSGEMTFIAEVTLGNFILLRDAFNNGKSIKVSKTATCGLTEIAMGGGSTLDVDLEKDFIASPKIYEIHDDDYAGIDKTYGLSRGAWMRGKFSVA